MNTKLKALFARRSIRKFEDKEVEEALVQDLLEAAMAAPSACCKDPWHFIVSKDANLLARIAGGLPNGPMLTDAGVGFVVCGDLNVAHDGQLSYMLQDCSAAIENLLLAADKLGLGAVWLGVHPREERIAHVRALFDLPSNIVPISAVAVGWPAEKKDARTRYDDSKVHREKW